MPIGFLFTSPRALVSSPNQRPASGEGLSSAADDHTNECSSTVSGFVLELRMLRNRAGATESSMWVSGPDHIPIHLVPFGSASMPVGKLEFVNVVSGSQFGSTQRTPAGQFFHTPSRNR